MIQKSGQSDRPAQNGRPFFNNNNNLLMTNESTNSLDFFTTLQNNNENVSLIKKNNDVRIFLYTYGFVLKFCSMYLLTAMAYFQYITNKNETKSQRKTSKSDSRFKKALKWKLNEFCLLTCFFRISYEYDGFTDCLFK